MRLAIYDPQPGHEYITKMYFGPIYQYCRDNLQQLGLHSLGFTTDLDFQKDTTVLINSDHLTPEVISKLKNNGNKIVGFSCTDSSYVSQACRAGEHLKNIDLMFMLTGIQTVNHGKEMIIGPNNQIHLEWRQFLPEEDWLVFDTMRKEGRLQSLPYVHWEKQPVVIGRPYAERSQKALIRGGHHMRRFILALHLLDIDKLDVNSGFYTAPYFESWMNPQFKYCDDCQREHRQGGGVFGLPLDRIGCTNPNIKDLKVDLTDLGSWNNKCPRSFMEAALAIMGTKFMQLETAAMLKKPWLSAEDHLKMLARITFTSDLKWLFSIYAAQRFWDAASVGCINVLPHRTCDQQFFPEILEGHHYKAFSEDLWYLQSEFHISQKDYDYISSNARSQYEHWIRPTDYAINTNLLKHIWEKIESL